MNGRLINLWSMLLAVVVIVFCGCHRRDYLEKAAQAQREEPAAGVIIAVGDSLTSGYGVSEEEAYPARLEKKLREGGWPWRVINAGISGETSGEALSRVEEVAGIKPDIVILETGANDGLTGMDPALTQRNIEESIRILKQHKITVLLAGMRLPEKLGKNHRDAFARIYPEAARKYDLILIPFFLADVAANPSLNQEDGLHPSAEGYVVVADMVYPYVLQAIRERSPRKGG